LVAYDFEDYRILLLQLERGGKFRHTPTAIFNSKKSDKNYMINVKAQFKNDYDSYTLFDKFPIDKFEDISCLMKLDKDLYPRKMIKFSNSKIVLSSDFKYKFQGSHQLEQEVMHFFIDADHYYPNLQIDRNSCIEEIMDRVSNLSSESNLIIFAKPSVFNDTTAPLWIFSGAHRYH
jgi:hypothetical protein